MDGQPQNTLYSLPIAAVDSRRAKYQEMMTPEQEAVLRSIRKLVDFWNITAKELGGSKAVKRVEAPVVHEPMPPKYRHPRTGETWDGEGTQPPWLREALTKQGYTVEELKFNSPLNQPSESGN
jgi:DNA-binding protein H-NS